MPEASQSCSKSDPPPSQVSSTSKSQTIDAEDAPPAVANGTASLRELCDDLASKIQSFLAEEPSSDLIRSTQQQTRASLNVISEALQRYSLPELSLSYNGGKDCLVLLILYLASLSQLPDLPLAVESIYIVPPHPFAAVDRFVASSAFRYHLSLLHLKHDSMRAAFDEYLTQRPQIKAIFVGTRRTDPHGAKLTSFDPTDGGWPPFMRVHPVIDWHYAEIWTFIRKLDVPYCELYDLGYTSLGGTQDTHPNPALKVGGEEGRFKPAYELMEDDEERLGRQKTR